MGHWRDRAFQGLQRRYCPREILQDQTPISLGECLNKSFQIVTLTTTHVHEKHAIFTLAPRKALENNIPDGKPLGPVPSNAPITRHKSVERLDLLGV